MTVIAKNGKVTVGMTRKIAHNKGLAIAGGKYKVHVLCLVEICILVESFGFDLPVIAKPRNVACKRSGHPTNFKVTIINGHSIISFKDR